MLTGGSIRFITAAADLAPVVAGTEGVTASFAKEMTRRTVLTSLRPGERPPVLRDAHFTAVLAEMNGEPGPAPVLLGAGPDGDTAAGADQGQPPDLAIRPGPARYRRFR